MEYYIGSIHWLDALTPPLAVHLDELAKIVKATLQINNPTRSRSTNLVSPSQVKLTKADSTWQRPWMLLAIVVPAAIVVAVWVWPTLVSLSTDKPTAGSQPAPVMPLSDLSVTLLDDRWVRPLRGYSAIISDKQKFYVEGALVTISLSHNLAGPQKITVRNISPVVAFVPGTNPELTYSVPSSQLGGAGLATPRQFVVRLNGGKEPSEAWIDETGKRQATLSANLLDTDPPKLLTLDPDDNTEILDISIYAMQPGTYELAFDFAYSIGASDKSIKTNSIWIYRR
jgi:hypothetical protein